MALRRRYLFRIQVRAGGGVDAIFARLRSLGVDVDDFYGAVPLDAARTLFVVRGVADEESVARVERAEDVLTFPDSGIEPLDAMPGR